MDLNKWEAFLSDPELKNNQNYQSLHNGEYLFGKISHDSLACLNYYLAVLSLLRSSDVEVGDDTLVWFEEKKSVVETAVAEIYSLPKKPKDCGGWPVLIKLIGSKLRIVQTYADEFHKNDETANKIERDLVSIAIVNLQGIHAIYRDIQAEDYKKLLTTSKYHS